MIQNCKPKPPIPPLWHEYHPLVAIMYYTTLVRLCCLYRARQRPARDATRRTPRIDSSWHTQRGCAVTDSEKLLELFRIIDDPDGWYSSLSVTEQLFCRAWLVTGNRLFAYALLQKVLPEQVDYRVGVVPVEGFQNLVVQVG